MVESDALDSWDGREGHTTTLVRLFWNYFDCSSQFSPTTKKTDHQFFIFFFRFSVFPFFPFWRSFFFFFFFLSLLSGWCLPIYFWWCQWWDWFWRKEWFITNECTSWSNYKQVCMGDCTTRRQQQQQRTDSTQGTRRCFVAFKIFYYF